MTTRARKYALAIALMALSTAANAQVTLCCGLILPPPEYDRPFVGELTITRFEASDQQKVCPGTPNSAVGCTMPPSMAGPRRCRIYIPHDARERLARYGFAFEDYLRHERSHCVGWPADHPGALRPDGTSPLKDYRREWPVAKPDDGRARRLAECKALGISCYEP
jgi:hypothetical protein